MSKIMKHSFAALALMLAVGFTSCTDDCDYSPAPLSEANTTGATFSDENSLAIEVAPKEAKEFTIPVTRTKTDAAVDIPILVIRNDKQVFNIPASVQFAAGASEAEIKVTFPDAVEGELYKFEIALDNDALYSQEVLSNKSGSVQCIKWEAMGEGFFHTQMFGASIPVEIYKARHTTWYKVYSLVEEGKDIVFKVDVQNEVTVEKQAVFTHPSYGTMYIEGSGKQLEKDIVFIANYTVSAGPFAPCQEVLTLP